MVARDVVNNSRKIPQGLYAARHRTVTRRSGAVWNPTSIWPAGEAQRHLQTRFRPLNQCKISFACNILPSGWQGLNDGSGKGTSITRNDMLPRYATGHNNARADFIGLDEVPVHRLKSTQVVGTVTNGSHDGLSRMSGVIQMHQ
jgi:hypothetical protein